MYAILNPGTAGSRPAAPMLSFVRFLTHRVYGQKWTYGKVIVLTSNIERVLLNHLANARRLSYALFFNCN